jgi:hypothetical protein
MRLPHLGDGVDGEAWGGQKGGDEAAFPQTMRIDFVRVYQR